MKEQRLLRRKQSLDAVIIIIQEAANTLISMVQEIMKASN